MKRLSDLPFEKLTLFAIIAIGAFYLFVLPPNSNPDEPIHFKGVYQVANAITGHSANDADTVAMRKADAEILDRYPEFPEKKTYNTFKARLFEPLKEGGDEIVYVKRELGIPHPYIYAPQTVGVLIGRALALNGEWVYMLGRIFNLIFYAVCIWLAVRLAPIGKGAIALIALYPMAVELAASLNSDTYSIALAFLALAQYLRIAYADKPARLRDLLLLLFTMAMLGPPKVVYIPLMMLAFFLPGSCFSTKKTAVFYRILTAGICVCVTLITLYIYARGADGAGMSAPFDEQNLHTPQILLADPVLFAKMCYRSLTLYFGFYLHSMIGSGLGWLEIYINHRLIEVFLALSVIAAFKTRNDENSLLKRDRIQFPAVFLIAALGTAVVMFLSWTEIGSWRIEGIQGRYFLPVWPLFVLFAARWKKPVRPAWLSDQLLLAAVCLLHIFVLTTAYAIIAERGTV